MSVFRRAVIDLAAITRNMAHLRDVIGTEHTMAVVKANGYGHGALESAKAALAGGADWLGVADIAEALELRAAGIEAPILAWLHDPDADFAPAIAAGVDIGVSSLDQLRQVHASAGEAGHATVQLKLETGLSRNGASEPQWAELFQEAAALERAGGVWVRGIFSHLSNASPEDDAAAVATFERGLREAELAGIRPALVHLAATAAALRVPSSRFNLVRLGIGIYGLSPFADATSADLALTPAMTLVGTVAAVRRVPAGAGVSYGYIYRTGEEATLALVPLGYADGVPRRASNAGPVSINGVWHTVSGLVAMDQFVVDVAQQPVAVGDPVVLFGDPAEGVPSADDWARASGTINYEIVTRIGPRVSYDYRGAGE